NNGHHFARSHLEGDPVDRARTVWKDLGDALEAQRDTARRWWVGSLTVLVGRTWDRGSSEHAQRVHAHPRAWPCYECTMASACARASRALDEEGLHLEPLDHALDVFVRGARGEALGGVEHLGQQIDVAGGDHERSWLTERPMQRDVDVALLRQRLIPRRGGPLAAHPRPIGQRLGGLDSRVS